MVLEGRAVVLRSTEWEDLGFLKSIWNNGDIMRYSGHPQGLGIDSDGLERWYRSQEESDGSRAHFVIRSRSGEKSKPGGDPPIGEAAIRLMSERTNTGYPEPRDGKTRAWSELRLTNKTLWGKRLGAEALQLLAEFAFSQTDADTLLCSTHRDDDLARQAYVRCGYAPVGRIQEGEYEVMELPRSCFQPGQEFDIDLWGRILEDCASGKRARFLVRRDDGFAEFEEARIYFSTEFGAAERKALSSARGAVLDVGCGPGRHALYLAGKGLRVTGVDLSPGAIRAATARGLEDAHVMDAGELRFKRRFETFLLMGNNMGLAGDLERSLEFFKKLGALASDDALLIGCSVDPRTRTSPEHLGYRAWNAQRFRYMGQVTLRLEYSQRRSAWWDLVLLEPRVLGDLLAQAGWKVQDRIPGPGGLYFVVAGRA